MFSEVYRTISKRFYKMFFFLVNIMFVFFLVSSGVLLKLSHRFQLWTLTLTEEIENCSVLDIFLWTLGHTVSPKAYPGFLISKFLFFICSLDWFRMCWLVWVLSDRFILSAWFWRLYRSGSDQKIKVKNMINSCSYVYDLPKDYFFT